MKFSLVIPAFNEEGNIGKLVEEAFGVIPANMLAEIIVVDDSSDKNLAMLRAGIDSEARPFNAPVTLHLADALPCCICESRNNHAKVVF